MRQQIIRNARRELLDAIVVIAGEVIGEELQARPETILSRIDRAQRQILDNSTLTLFLHPYDRAKYHEYFAIPVREDAEICPGDARLEAGSVSVVLDAARHLHAIREVLLPGGAGEI